MSGKAVAEPAIPLMKSGRRIAGSLPRYADDGFQQPDYSRDLRSAEWGSMINLRCKSLRHTGTDQLNIRFTPESRHCRTTLDCPLSAKRRHSGARPPSLKRSVDSAPVFGHTDAGGITIA
jgi:hypothetical protein